MIRSSLEEAYKTRASMLDEINRVSPWHSLHRTITRRRLADLIPSGKVLDLAAGTGLTGRELAARGCQVTMVEALPHMCELARNAVPKSLATTVEVICTDVSSYRPTEPLSFDAVVCTQALNFFANPADVIETAALALKPKGVFYFDIDNPLRWVVIEALAGHIKNARAIADIGEDVERNIVGAHYYFHSADLLSRLLLAHGFKDIRISGLLYVVPFLHLFHPSADFMEPEKLHPSVRTLLNRATLDELLELEERLTQLWPAESAGYQVFVANKVAAQ